MRSTKTRHLLLLIVASVILFCYCCGEDTEATEDQDKPGTDQLKDESSGKKPDQEEDESDSGKSASSGNEESGGQKTRGQLTNKNSKQRILPHDAANQFEFKEWDVRVMCTKGPYVDKDYNERTCRKALFDKLDTLTFFIIGDMGGSATRLALYPYTTHAQRSVAAAMKIVAEGAQPQFIVNLGDNFYYNGVPEVRSERFEKTFENMYAKPVLNVPWFPIMGNHDRHGSTQAQIDYTRYSDRWTMPADSENRPWYKVKYEFGSASKHGRKTVVELLMIDTILKCGETEDVRSDSYIAWIFVKSNANPKEPLLGKEQFAKEQDEWLERSILNSDADYLFVAGHYPVYSVGKHGFYNNCLAELDQFMRDHQVTAYLSGHDHNLQHLQLTRDGSTFDYIVSGAGAATDRSQDHWDEFSNTGKRLKGDANVLLHFPSKNWWMRLGGGEELLSWTTGGFVQAQVTPDKMTLTFYSGQGSLCLDEHNVPILGHVLNWLPIVNQNCKQVYGTTTLCPRRNPNCRKPVKPQEKEGGGHWWCLWIC